MAVTIDAVSQPFPGDGRDNVASFSWTHTPTGTPTAVGIAMPGYAGTAGAFSLVNVTYGGIVCPLEVTIVDSVTTGQLAYIFGLASPPSGPQTVVVNAGTGSDTFYGEPYCVSVIGSDPVTVFSGHNSATQSGDPSLACPTASDEIVMDAGAGAGGHGHPAAGINQTDRVNYLAAGALPCFGSTALGSDGGVMSWTNTTISTSLSCAASFKTPSSAPSNFIPLRRMASYYEMSV